jgi:hypothetical protein
MQISPHSTVQGSAGVQWSKEPKVEANQVGWWKPAGHPGESAPTAVMAGPGDAVRPGFLEPAIESAIRLSAGDRPAHVVMKGDGGFSIRPLSLNESIVDNPAAELVHLRNLARESATLLLSDVDVAAVIDDNRVELRPDARW